MFGVFRVKNHDFTQKKIIFFSNFRGGGSRVRPPLDPPLHYWVTIYNKVIIIAKIGVSDM